jgi:hypothetical protein
MQPAPDATAPANAPAPATDVAATPAPNPNDPNANAMGSGMSTAQETAATPAAADPNAPMTFSQEGMNPVDLGTITADQLIGTKVIGPENNEIAEVGDIVLTDDGKIDALLVDFGGFLGIGEKRVAVGVDNLQFLTDQNGAQYVWLNVTKEQLDAAAAYDENTYKDTRDAQRLVISQS